MRVEYCVILMRLTLTFVGALEDSDVHNGENCGAAPSFGPPTGMIFSSCSSWLAAILLSILTDKKLKKNIWTMILSVSIQKGKKWRDKQLIIN